MAGYGRVPEHARAYQSMQFGGWCFVLCIIFYYYLVLFCDAVRVLFEAAFWRELLLFGSPLDFFDTGDKCW